MGEVITLTLNDALYNAGIVGFLKICKNKELKYKEKGNKITFDSDILENFTEYYLETMMDTFREDIIYAEIINRISKIEGNKKSEDFKHIFDENFQYIADKMKRRSYIAGYEIIKSRGEIYNYQNVLNDIKYTNDYEFKLETLDELKKKMQQYKDVFMMKDIAYTKIQPFWSGIAFLHKTKNLEEFSKSFDDKITQSAKLYAVKNEKNGNISCIQCGAFMSKSEASPMSWINDVGVDSAKKPSSFWNFNVDAYLCPICTMIYSCMPLGFTMRNSEGIFINSNSSVKQLFNVNATFKTHENQFKNDIFYLTLDKFINDADDAMAKNEIENIQVVRTTDKGYLFNILSKDKLQILNDYNKELKYLVGKYYKKGKDYINVYREVLNKILNGANLYPIIYEALYENIKNNSNVSFIYNLLIIQTAIYSNKGGRKMNRNYNYHIMMQGDDLRRRMGGDGQNENKIKSLSHRLINSLKTRNPHDFIDVILRQYMSLGVSVPSIFMNTLTDEEEFLNIGYAFLTGLNGGAKKDNKENMEEIQ